ncbi:TMEM165/GDT1 family protein [Thermoanaerobacterium sp. DL9XJH110]|uniref:TMEM165/GDT1 family protein n=1 Tax=Thermoanaerobacterium sp. DL9XJH110 TaxID=3386643 RepID=UPI003BB76E49
MLLWKTFITTFTLVFLAELGDKTQLSTMLMAAHNESYISVFLGASLALISSTLIGVYLGAVISRSFPIYYIHLGAGIAFIIIGILLIAQKI